MKDIRIQDLIIVGLVLCGLAFAQPQQRSNEDSLNTEIVNIKMEACFEGLRIAGVEPDSKGTKMIEKCSEYSRK